MNWDQSVAPLLVQSDVYHKLRSTTGCPARLTIHTGEPSPVTVPGLIRRVVVTGLVVDMEIPVFELQSGTVLDVEIMSKDALVRFRSVLQEADSSRTLYLALPDSLESVQRRKHPRIDVQLEALTSGDQTEAMDPVRILNLSIGGVGYVSSQPQLPGDTATLQLSAVGLSPAEIPIRVVRCEPVGNGQYMVGVAFQTLNPAQETKLSQYISAVLRDQ